MSEGGASVLDLPPLRGNPFDHRPIESGRAENLIGRDNLLSQWREYLISQNPRLLLLVGNRGSGRTSFINALAAQTSRRPYIGQYWPEVENPAHGIIHEVSIHFGGFEVSPSIQQVSDRLVEMLDNETGVLPLIAFDYPSHVDLNPVLSRLAPMLQRLRALVVVTATPGQLSKFDEEILDVFDEPQYLSNLNEKQIQALSNSRIARSANQKWNIRPTLLKAIHENTDGNPRRVVKLLRDLIDERHNSGEGGVLDRLMTWRAPSSTIKSTQTEVQTPLPPLVEASEVEPISVDDDFLEEEIEDLEVLVEDDFEEEPEDLWGEEEEQDEIALEPEKPSWQDDFSAPSDIWEAEEVEEEELVADIEDEERIHEFEEESLPSDNLGEEYQSTEADNAFLYMAEGTEPPQPPKRIGGNFGSLVNRNRSAADKMPTGPDDTEIEVAQSHPSLMPRPIKPPVRSMKPESVDEKESQARIDTSVDPLEDEPVFHTENALWVVESGSQETLPSPSAYTPPEPEPEPEPEIFETEWFVDDPVQEEPIVESVETPQLDIPDIPTPQPFEREPIEQVQPIVSSIPIPTSFGPVWEPDLPFDPLCLHALTEAERMVLEASMSREVSPSDQELQARLEVGRSRLSQIYNGMRRKGLLSVRKQGRTRYFKLSDATGQHLRRAAEGVV